MFKMFAVMCVVTVVDCRTMYEDPPRIFDTKAECEAAAEIKEKNTVEMLTDEDGFLTVEHLEVGCEKEPYI